jgi:hypothetical protein
MSKYKKLLPDRTLYFDIETMPCVGVFWRPGYNITVHPEAILRPSWASLIQYKWKDDKEVKVIKLTKQELIEGNDKSLWERFIPIYNSADLVVTQNGKRFDVPWLKYRAMIHGLTPVKPLKQVDTKVEWAREFASPSNKLDYMGKVLGFGGKDVMNFNDWLELMKGNMVYYRKMIHYGAKDVILLQQVHKRSFDYLPSPAIVKAGTCPGCLSKKVVKNGTRRFANGWKQHQMCKGCGRSSYYEIKLDKHLGRR